MLNVSTRQAQHANLQRTTYMYTIHACPCAINNVLCKRLWVGAILIDPTAHLNLNIRSPLLAPVLFCCEVCGAAGSRLQTQSGRIVFSGHNGPGGGVCVWYSDDGGRTYNTTAGGGADGALMITGNEQSIADLGNGSLYMVCDLAAHSWHQTALPTAQGFFQSTIFASAQHFFFDISLHISWQLQFFCC